jgi:DNA-binding LacI/PurR family transcriptional regulator
MWQPQMHGHAGESMTERVGTRVRSIDALVGQLREQIASSFYREGGFLPSTRELAEGFGVSAETVRRGLKQLEREGVLEAEPRAGFRITVHDESNLKQPVAFITDNKSDLSNAQPATWALSIAFQGCTAARGWSILNAHSGDRDYREVLEQIHGGNAWGVILDTIDDGLRKEIFSAGLPLVMVNSWIEDSSVDVVLQDNYRGGFLAAEHLVGRGFREIAWIGATSEFCHSRERLAGANAALSKYGLRIEDQRCIAGGRSGDGDETLNLLTGKDRPDGILAFGSQGMSDVLNAAKQLDLEVGSDLEVIGWTVEECYELHYRALFEGGRVSPAVVWSGREMAERAVALLAERGEGAGRRAVRACVATELRIEGEGK